MKELLELVEARRHAPDEIAAVATVLRVEGSSYRRTGARMLINRHGRVAGSVSGGCLEQSVIDAAREALHDGRPRLLTFDTTDPGDVTFGSGLGCRGKIWIGLEVLQPRQAWPLAELALQICNQRQPAALLTWIRRRDDIVSFESTSHSTPPVAAKSALPAAWCETVRDVFAHGRNGFVGQNDPDSALVEWLTPPVALWIFGGGPDVPPLTRLAHELGYEIAVIDRRPEVARRENFPAATRVLAAPAAEIPASLQADALTVAVLMNHHYETDRSLLAALLPLGLPYVAALGPRQRTERILRELAADGHEIRPEFFASLHAPAGLDLGADTPVQIALSILAEIQAVLAGRPAGMLKFRLGEIHAAVPENIPCAVPA
jgi:xanthine dehydrogenase accessory factor